jgi:hypothetical protein
MAIAWRPFGTSGEATARNSPGRKSGVRDPPDRRRSPEGTIGVMCHRGDVPKTDGEMGDRFSIDFNACRPFGTGARVFMVFDGLAARVHGLAPRVHGLASRAHGLAPRGHGLAPRVHELAPRGHGLAPRGHGLAPRVHGLAPMAITCRPFGTGARVCLPRYTGWHLASMGWHPWLLHGVPSGLVRVFSYRGTRVGAGSMGWHPWLLHGVPSGLVRVFAYPVRGLALVPWVGTHGYCMASLRD